MFAICVTCDTGDEGKEFHVMWPHVFSVPCLPFAKSIGPAQVANTKMAKTKDIPAS